MFAIALLVFGLLTTALVWVVGIVVFTCALGDNAIRIAQGMIVVAPISGWFLFKGDQAIASGILNTMLGLFIVVPLATALIYALLVRPWTVLPIVAAISSLVAALVILFC